MELNSEMIGAGFESDVMGVTDISYDNTPIFLDRINKIRDLAVQLGGFEESPRKSLYASLGPPRPTFEARGGVDTIVVDDTPFDDSIYSPMISTLKEFSDMYQE